LEVKFIDLQRENKRFKEKIKELFSEIIDKSAFVGGKFVEEFEKNFAEYIGVNHCISVNSGTDALILSIAGLLLNEGSSRKKIITTPFTFFATAEAILRAGGEVVFCDIDERDLNLNPDKVEEIIDDETCGIIPVHIFGMPADMDKIGEIAKKYNLWVVEDACQSHGAKFKDKKTGSIGDAGVFSFYPTKNLNGMGDGGAITTNNTKLAETLILLKNHGQVERYRHEFIGFNSRLDGIQAAILNEKLKYLDEYNNHRIEMAKIYDRELKGVGDIRLPETFPDRKGVFHLYTIRTRYRDELKEFLNKNGVQCGIYYPIPLFKQTPFNGAFASTQEFPITEKVVKEVISLPLHNEIKKEEVEFVSHLIREFFKGK